MLTEIESKKILQDFGFNTTNPVLARSASEAMEVAVSLVGPFAMKIVSPDIVHKVAAGGVRLNVEIEDVSQAYADIIDACRKSYPAALVEGVLLESMVEKGVEVFLG